MFGKDTAIIVSNVENSVFTPNKFDFKVQAFFEFCCQTDSHWLVVSDSTIFDTDFHRYSFKDLEGSLAGLLVGFQVTFEGHEKAFLFREFDRST